MADVDGLVLDEVENRVLTRENIRAAEARADQLSRERRRERPDEEPKLRKQLAQLRAELGNYLDLVGAGKAPQSVLQRITTLEARIEVQERELAEYRAHSAVSSEAADERRLGDNLRRFRELLGGRSMPKMRQVLRALLQNKNVFWLERLEDGGYRVTGETVLGALFEGVIRSSGAQERT